MQLSGPAIDDPDIARRFRLWIRRVVRAEHEVVSADEQPRSAEHALLAVLVAVERAAIGLRNPGGPVASADSGAALIAGGIWQAVIFIGLPGWPFAEIPRRSARLLGANIAVIGLGVLTYLALIDLADWQPPAINALGGCLISAA